MTSGSELFIIIKSVDPDRNEDLRNATEELANYTQTFLGGTTEITYMNINNRSLVIK